MESDRCGSLKRNGRRGATRWGQLVERHAGWTALDKAWVGPENLPTLPEIENPVLWLERVQ